MYNRYFILILEKPSNAYSLFALAALVLPELRTVQATYTAASTPVEPALRVSNAGTLLALALADPPLATGAW